MGEREVINALIAKILAEWADKGKIIEGGWMAYVAATGLQGASDMQVREMRKAFMLGAQHLFSSMIAIMEADREPTEQDMKRMDLIHRELEAFRVSLTQ